METERKLLKLPLGFRSKIPRRGIHEYQRPKYFAKHNALCKRDENYGILMGKPNNAICLDYDIYDPNCKEKQKYTLEYFRRTTSTGGTAGTRNSRVIDFGVSATFDETSAFVDGLVPYGDIP